MADQAQLVRELGELNFEQRSLLWRLCAFCDNWEGKIIRYWPEPWPGRPPEIRKGLVWGHDGPQYDERRGGWFLPNWLDGAMGFGWGAVVIRNSPGIHHHIDPALILGVEEIVRDRPEHSAYEHEAVDLYCPYGCDADGLTDWDVDWGGPEYEVFCPVHRAEAYERGHDLYHRESGFDGSDPEAERAYYDLTKIAYDKYVKGAAA